MNITPQTYRNYFETIAINNKLIGHVTGDEDNKRFYALDIEEVLNGLRRNFTGYSLILEDFESKFSDQLADNIREYHQSAFSIVKNYDARADGNDALTTILDSTYAIVKQIITKVRKDYRNRVLSGLDINSFQLHKVGPILTAAYGYRCTFSFNQPANLAFVPAQWDNEDPAK